MPVCVCVGKQTVHTCLVLQICCSGCWAAMQREGQLQGAVLIGQYSRLHGHFNRLANSTGLAETYLWWSLCTLYLHACQARVTIGDSGLCCCISVTYFKR